MKLGPIQLWSDRHHFSFLFFFFFQRAGQEIKQSELRKTKCELPSQTFLFVNMKFLHSVIVSMLFGMRVCACVWVKGRGLI